MSLALLLGIENIITILDEVKNSVQAKKKKPNPNQKRLTDNSKNRK